MWILKLYILEEERSESGSSSEAASSTTKPDEGEKSHHLRGCRGMAGHQSQK